MTTVTRRTSNPFAELLGWLEGGRAATESFGLARAIPIQCTES